MKKTHSSKADLALRVISPYYYTRGLGEYCFCTRNDNPTGSGQAHGSQIGTLIYMNATPVFFGRLNDHKLSLLLGSVRAKFPQEVT